WWPMVKTCASPSARFVRNARSRCIAAGLGLRLIVEFRLPLQESQQSFQQLNSNTVILSKLRQLAVSKALQLHWQMPRAGIAAVCGVQDMIPRGIRQHARRIAVAEHAAVLLVRIGIDEPDIGVSSPFGSDELPNRIHVKLHEIGGGLRKLALAKEIHFSNSPAMMLNDPSAAIASER